jgi:hypothetical protein
MNFSSTSHKARVVLAGVAVCAAGVALAPSSASALSNVGSLQVAGPGTAYTATGHTVSQAVTSGSAASYTLKVTNTSNLLLSYTMKLVQSGHGATVSLSTTGLNAKTLSPSSDGSYSLGYISSNASTTYTLKVTPSVNDTTTSNVDAVLYQGSDQQGIEYTRTSIQAQTGTTGYDLFAKQGSQLNVGGSVVGQYATAPALAANAKAAYTLTIKNDGSVSTKVGLVAKNSCAASFPATYTVTSKNLLGQTVTTDITSAVNGGTYQTGSLGSGASQVINVSIVRSGTTCDAGIVAVSTKDENGNVKVTENLVANAAV